MNTTEFMARLSLTALGSYIVLCFDVVAAPIIILLTVMAVDYATGLLYAYISKTLSSKVGFKGIIKKVSYLFAVGIAFVVDFLLTSGLFGVENHILGFTVLVVIWFILNEVISIIENLNKIGVPLPKFMQILVRKLRDETDNKFSDNE